MRISHRLRFYNLFGHGVHRRGVPRAAVRTDERRSEIVYASEEFNPEDFYADDDMVITISHMGYIKRTPLAEYRTQNRGGVGAKGSATRDEDFIEHIYVASMHNTMLFFTEKGRCFWLKVYEIPEGARSSKGRAIQNVIQIEPDDKVRAYINVKSLADAQYDALLHRKGPLLDRKSTRLNSSHSGQSRMPSSA